MKTSYPSRRAIVLGCASVPIAPTMFGQRRSPAVEITHSGATANTTVESVRPLHSLAHSFRERYGLRVTFEECPLLFHEDSVDVTVNPSAGIRVYNPRGGQLRFSYDIRTEGKIPTNPADALTVAIAQHNRSGLPGRYELLESVPYFHIIPTETRDKLGEWNTNTGPLEVRVSLKGRGRSPQEILVELLDQIADRYPIPVHVGPNAFVRGDIHPRIDLDFIDVAGRDVLRSLLEAYPRPLVWSLLYGVRQNAYGLSIITIPPKKDSM